MIHGSHRQADLLRGVLAVLVLVAAMTGCKREELRSFRGVTDGEYVRVAAPAAGNLATLAVKRGERVTEGRTVFSLAEAGEVAAHEQAAKRLEQMQRRRDREGAATDPDQLDRLKGQVAQTQWKLAQKSANAPVNGVVTETLYSEGEWVPAGAPVVAILAVDKLKVRFEVPLSVAAHLQNGRRVSLSCERCRQPIDATVTYVSPFAQAASAGAGAEGLRYAVEARPDPERAALLQPGQPVTVNL